MSHLVVFKFYRFARSVEDTAIYTRRLQSLGIRLVSATEQTDDSPSGRFAATILSAVDELDNSNRAARSLLSMKATFKAGRWAWSAPIGYTSASKPFQCLQIDPVRGPFIVKLFEMLASGQAKKSTALTHLTNLGLRSVKGKALNQETVARLLKNELYCGRMYAKKWNLRVKGDFVPLASEELFDRVQMCLAEEQPSRCRTKDRTKRSR